MPTITQLEYIIAVDTSRHFGLAAKTCFVTQPTLSMQIKKAENELNILIFDRSKQPIAPTDIGKILIQQARNILREVRGLNQIIDDYQNEVAGHLHVGVIPTLSPYLLPLFVGNFTKKYPKVKLHIKELHTHDLIKELQNDSLDLGVIVTPFHGNNINGIPLFYEEIKAYVHPQHSYYKKKEIKSSTLSNKNLWMLSEGNCFRDQTINLCSNKAKNNHLPFHFESGSLESLKRLVDKEGGFTLLPELAIGNPSSVRSIVQPSPMREISLIHITNFAKKKLLKIFAQEIKNAIPKKMLDANRGKIVEWL